MSDRPDLYVRPVDLRGGTTLNVYGRVLSGRGCDTGIGSVEDTLQAVLTHGTKPPRKDFSKWALNDGIVFRFHARLDTTETLTARRRFTIALYPSDDSLSIYEPPVKNSGFKGGVFLKRFRHRDAGGNLYTADMFHLGTTVSVHAHKFIIMNADKFTREKCVQ